MKRKGSRTLRRLGVFYLLILAAAIWMVSVQRFGGKADSIRLRTTAEAEAETQALLALFEAEGPAGFEVYLAKRLELAAHGAAGSECYYRLVDGQGEVRVGNIPEWGEESVRRISPGVILLDDIERPGAPRWWSLSWLLQGDYNPDYDLLLVERDLPGGGKLYVGRDTEYWSDLHVFYQVSAWSLLVVTLVGLAAGMLSSRSILRTMGKINGMAQEIIRTKDLGKRIPTDRIGSDFLDTVGNLNEMLDKIEESVSRIREASNGIAHDLRTPLTRLRNRLEELSSQGRSATPEEIDLLLGEVDGLLSTFRSILHISQLEMGSASLPQEEVDLATIARDAVEMYEPLLEERRQSVVFEGESALLKADGNLLFQLVSNFLDNARKYGPEGGRVVCRVQREADGSVLLEVTDEGAGIPVEHQSRVFERFYRLETSRGSPGVGLGLSMVAAIAQLHGATVSLRNRNPGLAAQVRFPA
ncbi:HAMP domain-containing sensor histidine kinase [Pelagicoccus sp. SDUM812005]|uniref:sensor histidine kinase n=1 Tax=Pelagicoccus sp. SDUM812005 TaxID=3041257 RepID=UPI00280DCD5C|nr:HAMP domain-containing sensor histidine kinase [Pelagicoccus sp. SDUM812005]MDQ8180397.1 HAMP domain-containing sensor histidine kinase [Pelagicoccus sp. SDUM812005]